MGFEIIRHLDRSIIEVVCPSHLTAADGSRSITGLRKVMAQAAAKGPGSGWGISGTSS